MESEESLEIEYSAQEISPWGGMKSMKELLDKTGIRDPLKSLPLPQPGSNRGYDPVQIIESFWVIVWLGASRFAHRSWLQYDSVIKEIFQWKQAPSHDPHWDPL